MAERGGFRKNSGRKKKNTDELKVSKQVYLNSSVIQRIDSLKIPQCHSFSAKASYLIDRGLDNLKKDDEVVKFADLFAGMGGIRIGFEKALQSMNMVGKAVFVSEIKKSAISVYKDNFGDEKINGDITKIDTDDIPDLDYVLAGFPCQAFSYAGKRLGFDDTRGTLFFDVARVIKAKRHKGFILENVEGLITHDNGRTFNTIVTVLKKLGYYVNYAILNSADFGLAQNRKRIYIIGNQKEEIKLNDFKSYSPVKLKDIIDTNCEPENDEFSNKLLDHYQLKDLEGKQIKDKRGGVNNIHSWDFELKGEVSSNQKKLLNCLLKQRRNKKWATIWGIDWMDGMPLTIDMIRTFFDCDNLQEELDDLVNKGYLRLEYPKKKTSKGRVYDDSKEMGYNIVTGKLSFKYSKILSLNECTPTIVATDVSHLAVPVNGGLRQLTTREGLRLFGYPETYSLKSVTKNKAFDLLGNTVAVNVIEEVSKKLLNVTEK